MPTIKLMLPTDWEHYLGKPSVRSFLPLSLHHLLENDQINTASGMVGGDVLNHIHAIGHGVGGGAPCTVVPQAISAV